MKNVLFLIFMVLNVLTIYGQNISAASVVFVKGSVATSYAITPKMFDRDSRLTRYSPWQALSKMSTKHGV